MLDLFNQCPKFNSVKINRGKVVASRGIRFRIRSESERIKCSLGGSVSVWPDCCVIDSNQVLVDSRRSKCFQTGEYIAFPVLLLLFRANKDTSGTIWIVFNVNYFQIEIVNLLMMNTWKEYLEKFYSVMKELSIKWLIDFQM